MKRRIKTYCLLATGCLLLLCLLLPVDRAFAASYPYPDDSEIRIGNGERVFIDSASEEGVQYRTTNVNCASVSNKGGIYGRRNGKVDIYVIKDDTILRTIHVTVCSTPHAVSASIAKDTLLVGDQSQISVTTSRNSASHTITYSSSDTEVAIVDENGLVTAIGTGSCEISVTTFNHISTRVSLTVKREPTSIRFQQSSYRLSTDEAIPITVLPFPEDTYLDAMSFRSEDPSVYSVDDAGLLTGISIGSTTIHAISGSFSAECTVIITPALQRIDIEKDVYTLAAGMPLELKVTPYPSEAATNLRYISSNTRVLQSDGRGGLLALSPGTAEVKVIGYNDVQTVCTVQVLPAPSSLKIEATQVVLSPGEAKTIMPIIPDNTYTSYTYSSSNPLAISVDNDGRITAQTYGTADITVTTHNGLSSTVQVSVSIVDYLSKPLYNDILQYTKALAEEYPELIRYECIGKTVLGKDMVMLSLGTGDKKVGISAALHARESVGALFVLRSIEEYAIAWTNNKLYNGYNLRKLFEAYTLCVIPCCNPDGMDINNGIIDPLYTDSLSPKRRITYKNNANGVNLNQNFPFYWGSTKGSWSKPDHDTYCGNSMLSEPESKALVRAAIANDFEWMLNIHTRGNIMYWRDTKNSEIPGDEQLMTAIKQNCGISPRCSTWKVQAYGGGYENWFRSYFHRPAICVELIPDTISGYYDATLYSRFNEAVVWEKTKTLLLQGMR